MDIHVVVGKNSTNPAIADLEPDPTDFYPLCTALWIVPQASLKVQLLGIVRFAKGRLGPYLPAQRLVRVTESG